MKNVTPSVSWRNFGIVMFLLGIAGTACGIFIHNTQFVLIYVFISLAISLACWTVWFSVFISFGQQEWTLRRWFFSTKRYSLNDIKSITFGTPAGGFTSAFKVRARACRCKGKKRSRVPHMGRERIFTGE